MNFTVHFLPEVGKDARQAYSWYENKDKGLGNELLRMFYAASYEIQRNPESSRYIYKDFRRKLLKRFPYCIYYKMYKKNIIIFGLFHTARNPHKIHSSFSKRL